ncbi:hypothetical protein LZL87_006089 [Fusarium oxysporum]|nr:hypothetical protein LZL87_006089 [Fusarium oxysporum]
MQRSTEELRSESDEGRHRPRQSPKEWLEELATTDFVNVRAVCSLDLDLVVNNISYFDLVNNDEATYTMAPYPDVLGHGQPIDSDFHPILLSLKTSALHGTVDSLLTLVFTVGQVMEQRKDKTYTSSLELTEYVLIIDAVAPGHPVWLIYNRNTIDDISEPITVEPADPDTPLTFKCIGHNFDAAQIFPTVNNWIQSYGNVDRTKFEESIKATCITGAVEAKELLLAETEELLRQ